MLFLEKNAKVGAIGLEQSCESPSFAKFGEKMDAFLKVGPQKLRLALCRYLKRQYVVMCHAVSRKRDLHTCELGAKQTFHRVRQSQVKTLKIA